jgi:hypothetical protein
MGVALRSRRGRHGSTSAPGATCLTARRAPRDTLAVRRTLLLASALLAPLHALGQSGVPAEALRAGPTPARVEAHGPVAFAREFSAARDGDTLRLIYTENGRNGRATLRSAALRAEGAALLRTRDDVTLADDARTVSLAWSQGRGAAVYVIPRRPPPPLAPGQRRPSRAPAVGVPASTRDPLGPSNLSGGDVVVQRLDAEGRAQGAPVTLFTENARLTRLSAAWVGDRLLVAWTGGAVTDDEVRVTVRARSLSRDGAPTRLVATHSGLHGDIGDTLEVTPDEGGGASLWVSASHCAAETSAPPGLSPPEDPSLNIEAPRRVLMPQQAMRDAPGLPVRCGPLSLFRVRLDARDEVLGRDPLAPLARDLAARAGERWILAVNTPQGVTLARGTSGNDGFALRSLDGAAITPEVPAARMQDLALRQRASEETTIVEAPVPPPDAARFDPGEVALLAAAGDASITVARGRRALHRLDAAGAARAFAVAPRSVTALQALDGATPWLLTREGAWSGAVRWSPLTPSADGAEPARWAVASPLSTPPPGSPPPLWDEAFARLWTRARAARAVFMRHENSAGALAARPEAPTDPRMPAIIANRTRLRGRWESVCGQLRGRASQLARGGAGPDVMQGVNSLCEIHADLQLGVPINPAL